MRYNVKLPGRTFRIPSNVVNSNEVHHVATINLLPFTAHVDSESFELDSEDFAFVAQNIEKSTGSYYCLFNMSSTDAQDIADALIDIRIKLRKLSSALTDVSVQVGVSDAIQIHGSKREISTSVGFMKNSTSVVDEFVIKIYGELASIDAGSLNRHDRSHAVAIPIVGNGCSPETVFGEIRSHLFELKTDIISKISVFNSA